MWTPDRGMKDLEAMIDRDMRSRYSERMIYGVTEIEVVDELDEEEDTPVKCEYCSEPVEGNCIPYTYEGKGYVCCEKCFFEMITDDGMFDEALMIMRNRTGGKTGILAVDLVPDRLISELEKANEAQLRKDCALYSIEKMRKVGA